MAALQDRLTAHKQRHLSKPAPVLGHACRPLYGHDDTYIEFNNGSFGSCPTYVLEAAQIYQREAERRPDFWHRGGFRVWLNLARKQLAALVNCHDVDDLVLVNNATTGVNAVLRGLQSTWKKDDALMVFDTAYGACARTAQYIVDSNPLLHLKLIKVQLAYPLTTQQVVQNMRAALDDAKENGVTVRIALIDAISSLPGVVVPWQQLVQLTREYGVLSLIDAAHAVGQIPLDLTAADPDFFISNCHKWLKAHRGCAFMYAPKRTQQYLPSMPTSHYYISPTDPPATGPPLLPTDAASNFVASWEFNGTVDLSNFLSLTQALEYREWLGGNDAIMRYNSTLARRGGQILTKLLGPRSVVMGAVELTAAMVNVSIPVDVGAIDRHAFPSLQHVAVRLQAVLADNNPTFIPFYAHNDKVWARVSAQVWLEERDFEWLGGVMVDAVQRCGWALQG